MIAGHAHGKCAVVVLAAALASFPLVESRRTEAVGLCTDQVIIQLPLPPQVQQEADDLRPLMLSDSPSEGPITVNSRKPTEWFDADLPTGSLDFRYLGEHDTTTQRGTRASTTSNSFQEALSLVTNGYIISPNLVDLKLGGTIGLQQDLYDAAGTPRSSHGLLDGWDVSATILRNEQAPITLYTHRTEQFVTPNFSPSLKSVDTTYGGDLVYHSDYVPTQVELYHSDDTQTELTGDAHNFTLSQDVFHLHSDAIALPHQTLGLDYNYRNTDEQEGGSGPLQYQTHDASLTHTYSFGQARLSSLTSSLSANLQTGNLPYQRYRLDENLQLHHSDTFQTHYDYTLEQERTEGISQTLNNADVGFVHRLFKSVVTSGDVGGSLDDATDSGEIQQVYARIDSSYQKIVPYGLFLSNINGGWQWQDSPGGTGLIPVLNQPALFTNSQPLVITAPNIVASSIKVLSPNGLPYLKGTDFNVTKAGNLTQISRIVGGLIPADGGVLLDYNLLPQAGHTTVTDNAGISARYEIDKGFLAGLSPYARYGIQRQTLHSTSRDLTLIPDSYDDVVAGTDYRLWLFTVNGEQEWFHSTISPYNASRFSAHFNDRLTARTSLSMSASYALIDYYDSHDYVKDTSISAALESNLTRGLTARVRAVWLDDEDRLFGSTRGLEEQAELDWHHNQTHIYARIRNATLAAQAQKSTFQELDVGISRSF